MTNQTLFRIIIVFLCLAHGLTTMGQNATIRGTVKDKKTGETLVGATIQIIGTVTGTITDFDGNYALTNLKPGEYSLRFSFVSYKPIDIDKIILQPNETRVINVSLEGVTVTLEGVTVVAVRRTNTEVALANAIKSSLTLTSGISEQQIKRSQDQDASQVVKRIPGISIIDDKFIVVRGLNQRYNGVWLNGSVPPSTEADQRAFSFDILPSAMIDNLMISKSPAPDLPADFGGGFIKILTKNMPDDNFLSLSYGIGYAEGTTFSDFKIVQGGKTDFLGFDDGTRALPSSIPASLRGLSKEKLAELGKQMNNYWDPIPSTAFFNQSFALNMGRKFKRNEMNIGTITSLTYSHSNESEQVVNQGYQAYRLEDGTPDFNHNYIDSEYAQKARIGLLHNWIFSSQQGQKFEFRNIFGINGKNESVIRDGLNNYEGRIIRSYQNSFMSRLTYSGQIGYEKKFSDDLTSLDAIVGYSFANRNEPDIKRLRTTLEEDPTSPYYGQYFAGIGTSPSASDAGRVFMTLMEHIVNAASNFERKFDFMEKIGFIKTGIYTEFKTRSFDSRILGFAKNSSYTESIWITPLNQLFSPDNINTGPDGFLLRESTSKSDSYEASNLLLAGYAAINLPLTEKFNIYGGIRVEQNNQHLNSYDRYNQPVAVKKDKLNLFPSINVTYNFNKQNLIRGAFGTTINRPEFREIAPFYFYNFEEEADFVGNTQLKDAIIQNFDLRYENYSGNGELFSAGVFYKYFRNPIELTYKPAGNRKNYTYENAQNALALGMEIDIRKSMETVPGLQNIPILGNLTVVANAAYIYSKVFFPENSIERDRSMQGQSPYIVNVGLFYDAKQIGTNFSVLYNIIGDRIRVTGEAMQNIIEDIPDIYEKHRHQIDITITKTIKEKIQIKAGVRDLLDQKVESYQPYANPSGGKALIMPVKSYYPGRNFSISMTYNF